MKTLHVGFDSKNQTQVAERFQAFFLVFKGLNHPRFYRLTAFTRMADSKRHDLRVAVQVLQHKSSILQQFFPGDGLRPVPFWTSKPRTVNQPFPPF